MFHISLALSLLVGCDDPYGDAKAADTIAAYEAFLDTKPEGTDKLLAEKRLEELMVARAEESKTLADYDAVIKRFPAGKKKKEMATARANVAFAEAEAAGTTEAWQKFLDDNPAADGALKKRARAMVDVAQYSGTLAISEPVVAEVNLANNPAGPKDGWGVSTTVTNNGASAYEYVNLELQFLDATGKKLKAVTYPVASETGPGGMAIEDVYVKPLGVGEARPWSYSTGELPEEWDKKSVRVVPVAIRPVASAAAPAAPQ